MVHRQHRVAMLQVLGSEEGVGRQRADQVKTFATQALEAGFDHLDLFPAQVTAFAGVRVESADQDARMGDAELVAQVGVEDARDPGQALVANGVGDPRSGRWVVARATRRPRVASIITTWAVWVRSARNSVWPEKGMPASLITPLVHRCGDHPGEVPVEAALAGAGQGFQDVGGVGSVHCPGRTGRPGAYPICTVGRPWPVALARRPGKRLRSIARPSWPARSCRSVRLAMAIRGGAGRSGRAADTDRVRYLPARLE